MQQSWVPQSPYPPQRRACSRGPDGSKLDAPLETLRELLLDPPRLEPPLGAVGEDEPRPVEDDLGGNRLRRELVASDRLAEEQHCALGVPTVLLHLLLVSAASAPDDPFQPPLQLGVGNLVIRLDDASELLPPGGLADHLLVPGELEPARVERVHLAARTEDDAYGRCHGSMVTRGLPALLFGIDRDLV